MTDKDNRTKPYVFHAGKGWDLMGDGFLIKASEVAEGSGSAFAEYTAAQGDDPEPHTHETEDEMFYVLEGEMTFRCGGKSFDVDKGGFIFLPRGLKHGYTVRSKEPARLLVVTSPVREGFKGGWRGFIADIEKDEEQGGVE
jgi:quercetin dioxygenase-like cupin family protein